MPIVKIAGSREINLVRTGPVGRPPVVLLHPVGLDLTWWDRQFGDLGRAHDVIAFDMPGHGLSAKLDGPPTFEALAAVVVDVLAHVQAKAAHIVGLSVGGMIAQTLAIARPDLVRSLSLIGTLCAFPEPVRAALRERSRVAREEGMAAIAPLSLARWFPATFRALRPDVLDRATKTLLAQDAQLHAAMWQMIASLDLTARLATIDIPTLVLTGTEDINAPPAAARQIAERIGGATLHEMQGVGHFAPVEEPETFNQILRSFLARTG